MKTIELEVQGMSCGSCVEKVTRALRTVDGVGNVQIDLRAGRVRVSGYVTEKSGVRLIAALAEAGYPSREASAPASAAAESAAAVRTAPARSGCCGGGR